MILSIDLRRKQVKVELKAKLSEIDAPGDIDVEVKLNKRQNRDILTRIPIVTAKLVHYLTLTSSGLLEAPYEEIEQKIKDALEREKSDGSV